MPNGLHAAGASDAELAAQLNSHVAANAALQVVVELLEGLRDLHLPWWSPAARRAAHPALERMQQLAERPDVRQRVMMDLTQMPPRASRRLSPEMQATLLDEVLAEDVAVEAFEGAFRVVELVAYGDPAGLLREVVAAFPWEEAAAPQREVLAILMSACLQARPGVAPALSWWELRMALDADAFQEHLPRAVRVAADRARLEAERAGRPFTARDELETVGLATLREALPPRAFRGLFDALLARLTAPPSPPAVSVAELTVEEEFVVESPSAEPPDQLDVPLALQEREVAEDEFCYVGGLPKEEIDLKPDNPWATDEMTDPGVIGAGEEEPAPQPARVPLRRRR